LVLLCFKMPGLLEAFRLLIPFHTDTLEGQEKCAG
jgi:hypothetical protein